MKFIILLHKVIDDYVTLFQVYECAISPGALKTKIDEGSRIFPLLTEKAKPHCYVVVDPTDYGRSDNLDSWTWDSWKGLLRTSKEREVEDMLKFEAVPFFVVTEDAQLDPAATRYRMEQFESVQRWYSEDWLRLQDKLRSSVVEGISVFLSMFDSDPDLKRVFCPPKECYGVKSNPDGRFGVPLPSFGELIESGKVVALNFSMSANPGVARAMGVFMKQDFQRAMLNRIPEMEKHPKQYFREALFLCDEYQAFATVGESDPTGDEKFFTLSRQAKCISIVATQSISSLKSTLPGESWLSRPSEKFLFQPSRKFLLTAVRLKDGTNRDEPEGTRRPGLVETS